MGYTVKYKHVESTVDQTHLPQASLNQQWDFFKILKYKN